MNTSVFFNELSIHEWILIGLYTVFFIIQFVYYFKLYRKPYLYATAKESTNINRINKEKDLVGISVIITAKDEAQNLRENLDYILKQDYPNYEVVVVNNTSTDSTDEVLEEFRSKYSNLRTTYIPVGSNNKNAKKLALTVGIKAAKHDILLFTESDTKPLTDKWVYEYAKTFENGVDVVLGACKITNSSYLKKYLLFDNLLNGINYLSMALIRKPYMGIGRNMAIRKRLFFENRGFSSILNIKNGEDNLFINRVASKKNTAVVVSSESVVETNAAEEVSNWRKIKRKYLTTQRHYRGNAKFLLGLEIFSRYAFYSSFAALCIIGLLSSKMILLLFGLILFLARYTLQLTVINKNSKLYCGEKFYLTLPFLDFMNPIINSLFFKKESHKK